MEGTELMMNSEANDRLHCFACNTRGIYLKCGFCSNNCEKNFFLMQGLVLGNVLQSLFGKFGNGSISQHKLQSLDMHFDFDSQMSTPERFCSPMTTKESEVVRHVEPSGESVERNLDLARETDATAESLILPNHSRHKPHLRTKSKCVRPNSNTRKKKQLDNTELRMTRQKSSRQLSEKVDNTKSKGPACSVVNKDSLSSVNDSIVESSSEVELEDHVPSTDKNNKVEKKRVKCKRCEKMISKSFLYVHYRAVHKDHLSDISDSSVSCSECGKMFMRNQALNAHKLKRHNHKFTNKCSHCGKGFASRFGLSWHMRQVHKVTVRQCGNCGETFENRKDYKKHRRYKHTANSHVCHICGKGFKLKNALQAHLDAHAGVKLHFCEICGDGFVRFSSLCQHRNNLHGPKKSELPFKCNLCPNTFRLQAWLDKHIQKHHSLQREIKEDCELCKNSVKCPLHGEMTTETFSCSQCDKVFAKDTNLKVHMKQHQEPKFSCDVCHKKFTYKCNMMRHRDTHNSEKPFHCDICAKQFCTKFLLASHMRMHNQDLMFKCEVCGKGLTRKDYLKNHMKKMHPDHIIQATTSNQ